jgi:hypothetical protein
VAAVIEVEEDAPPVVTAIARDLAACLRDRSFAERTDRTRGVVAIRSSDTPEAVTIRIDENAISVLHGVADDFNVVARAHLAGAGEPEPRIEGSDEHPELAEWAARLLEPPAPPWPEAAERFWGVLSGMPGAAAAVVVVDLESGERQRFGADDGPACELHGTPDALVAVLTGRVSAMEAAYDGTILVRCSFPDLSVLSGAGFRIRYGEAADG